MYGSGFELSIKPHAFADIEAIGDDHVLNHGDDRGAGDIVAGKGLGFRGDLAGGVLSIIEPAWTQDRKVQPGGLHDVGGFTIGLQDRRDHAPGLAYDLAVDPDGESKVDPSGAHPLYRFYDGTRHDRNIAR